MATLKEVSALKDKLKANRAQRADGAKAFREIAEELKAARATNDTAALDAVEAHLLKAATDLEV